MNPYPGMRPFRPDESPFFMGREVVLERVATQAHISPLTVLFARSGVGKSSFLTCRLIPALQKTCSVAYLNEWGSESPEILVERNIDLMINNSVMDTEQEKPLLILDQFEDIFKFPYDREKLWEKLAETVNIFETTVNVLVSMREEWLGAWGEAAEYLPDALNSIVRLIPLNDNELFRAVERPSEIEGTVTIEPELAKEIIQDLKHHNPYGLGEDYVEPGILQLVCRKLWDEAYHKNNNRMDKSLYYSIGRADTIAREFVWNELRRVGSKCRFSPSDRVLWSGLSRHLVVSQGSKSIFTPVAISKKVRLDDLGVAGQATVSHILPKADSKYLAKIPEKRGEPPPQLVTWVSTVLAKGVGAGFLKEQTGIGKAHTLFELSHDSLGPILQQFSVEFESWMRTRVAVLIGVAVAILFLVPSFIYLVMKTSLLEALDLLLWGTIFTVSYLAILWIAVKVWNFVWSIIGFPIIRLLSSGEVPLKVYEIRDK